MDPLQANNTGGIDMFKTLLTATLIMISSVSIAEANDFGTYKADIDFEQNYSDSLKAITSSKNLRSQLTNDRSIAGMSSRDEKWANEFDRIMADTKTDYLEKSLKLK
jgi:hypothetical protein